MRLSDFLSINGISNSDFALQIGTSKVSVGRYTSGRVVPRSEIMSKIVEATNGQVTPNDFYELPGKAGQVSPFRSRDGGGPLSRDVSGGRIAAGHGDGAFDPNQTDLFQTHAGASS